LGGGGGDGPNQSPPPYIFGPHAHACGSNAPAHGPYHWTATSQGSHPPHPPLKLLFFGVFLYFYLYLCCSHVNPNCLGFILFVYIGDLLSIVLSLLSLFDFLGSCIRSKLSSLSMLVFFGSWIRSKFIGVLILSMILSIIMSHGCQKLHFQVASTFLDLP
jgi:hypothetical protein